MQRMYPIRQVADLTNTTHNVIFNMSVDDAISRVGAGDPDRIREIEGNFALVAQREHIVRMARSLSVPMRYFVAKQLEGPALVVAHRIEDIRRWLSERDMSDQFHPTYTRMVPAHCVTEIALVGCPDPNPKYERFFAPTRETLPADPDAIGRAYVGALTEVTRKWLMHIPEDSPIGVCFSGGIDSGAVFLVVYHLLLELGMNPGRLKAFTLSVDGSGEDVKQARGFLETLDLVLFLEPIEVSSSAIDVAETIRIVEDYKPLDVQAAAMTLALGRGIRERYPAWRHLIDGDGGDENLKDYPIEENPELTIKSVLNNRLLYQEGWGIDSIKHSLTYSGGLSRGCTRTFAPLSSLGFATLSPFTLPDVIEVAEGIPFIELTDWDHDRLYRLKGDIVSRGVEAITGFTMPVFEKRRFQHGAVRGDRVSELFPSSPQAYRRMFQAVFDAQPANT